MPGNDVGQWWGSLAPAKTPEIIISRLNADVVRILGSAEISDFYVSLGGEPAASSPGQFAEFIQSEVSKWTKAQAEAGISQ